MTNLISTTSENYDLYYYDEDDHYWRNYKASDDSEDPNFNLNNGQGYLYANHDDTDYSSRALCKLAATAATWSAA